MACHQTGRGGVTSDPSRPLQHKRHETFAALLASPEKRTAVDCWILSDPSPVKPGRTAGREISASRVSKKPEVAARVAYLRAQRAAKNAAPIEVTAESIASLMADVTARFLSIAELATQLGLDDLAQRLRRQTVIHSGRASRLHERVGEVEERATATWNYEAALRRLAAA